MKIEIEIADDDAKTIQDFLDDIKGGGLTVDKLAATLMEDVLFALRRPGSNKGWTMLKLLSFHGHNPWEC